MRETSGFRDKEWRVMAKSDLFLCQIDKGYNSDG